MVPKQEPPDGKITEWTQPDQPIDPKKDHRIQFGMLRDCHQPNRWELWCSGIGVKDTQARESSKAEVYAPPADKMPLPGSGRVAIDSNGVVWQNWREPIK